VREGEHAHPSGPRELGGSDGGRVGRLGGTSPLLGREGRFVDEDVGSTRDVEDRARGRRIPGEHELAPGTRRAEHVVRHDAAAVGQNDGLAALELAEERALRDTESSGLVRVEAAGARRLDERVAVCDRPVRDLEDDDAVVPPLEGVSGPHLDELERVRELSEDAAESSEELDEPGRSEDGQGQLAPAEREGLQHPGEAQVMIGVEVGDEHLRQLDEAYGRAKQLPLGPLAAVDEDALAAAADERAGEPSPRGRHRAGGAQEDEVKIHAPSVRGCVSRPAPAAGCYSSRRAGR
jgi:hypothetical protein